MLGALYLRGAPRPIEPRRTSWHEVARIVRRTGSRACETGGALRDAGLWGEALVLETPGLLDWASKQLDSGRVLTAADPNYPWRWLRVLGASAPPALWRIGELPALPSVSIVGSRHISGTIARFCRGVASEASRLGFAVVSGRAEGCDRAAASGADHLIEIVPYGLEQATGPIRGCILSICPPGEPFATASAMERNTLIYAASGHTVIGHARFKEGGTWHGAVSASRGRLSTLIVRKANDPAMKALQALGGPWLEDPSGLSAALKSSGAQRALFENAV